MLKVPFAMSRALISGRIGCVPIPWIDGKSVGHGEFFNVFLDRVGAAATRLDRVGDAATRPRLRIAVFGLENSSSGTMHHAPELPQTLAC
jgi:hypothetical protein